MTPIARQALIALYSYALPVKNWRTLSGALQESCRGTQTLGWNMERDVRLGHGFA